MARFVFSAFEPSAPRALLSRYDWSALWRLVQTNAELQQVMARLGPPDEDVYTVCVSKEKGAKVCRCVCTVGVL